MKKKKNCYDTPDKKKKKNCYDTPDKKKKNCYDTPDHVLQEKVGYDLPEDVVMEVFSWLPVKSLMRFRCISKFWCSLMNESNFITKHLKHQEADKKKNVRLLVHSYDLASKKYVFSLFPDETLALPYYRYPDLELNTRPTHVLGPCNGIFCLENYSGTIALWNPATRQFRTLPPLPPGPESWVSDLCMGIGFGMDPKTNDYKVIVIMSSLDEQRKHVAVFSLGSGSWRVLDGNCGPVCAVNYSKFYSYANGFYYWFAFESFDKDDDFILSLDMINEVFQAIPYPAAGIPESVKDVSKDRSAFYENSIARILYDREEEERCYSIWVLKGGRWIKEVTFGPVLGGKSPLGFWKDGGLLLKRTSVTEELVKTRELVVSDPVTGEIKNVGIQNPERVFVYCESLVSLGGGVNYSTGEDLRDFLLSAALHSRRSSDFR